MLIPLGYHVMHKTSGKPRTENRIYEIEGGSRKGSRKRIRGLSVGHKISGHTFFHEPSSWVRIQKNCIRTVRELNIFGTVLSKMNAQAPTRASVSVSGQMQTAGRRCVVAKSFSPSFSLHRRSAVFSAEREPVLSAARLAHLPASSSRCCPTVCSLDSISHPGEVQNFSSCFLGFSNICGTCFFHGRIVLCAVVCVSGLAAHNVYPVTFCMKNMPKNIILTDEAYKSK